MEKIPLIILDKKKVVSASSSKILIYNNNKLLKSFPLFRISDLVVHIDNVLKPNVFKWCSKNKIPIHFINKLASYYGTYLQPNSKNIFLREAQYSKRKDKDFVLYLSKQIILGKSKNQAWVVKKYSGENKLPSFNLDALQDKSQILGVEGSIAQCYWREFSKFIKNDKFEFRFRDKNPPIDPVNSLLSYGYTLLVSRIITNILLVGLDPYFGFYHENHYRRPALALDLMEEFRPIAVDLLVLQLINKRRIKPEDFERDLGYVILKKNTRSFFVKEWLRWWFEKKFFIKKLKSEFTLNELSQVQVRKLAKLLVGEIKEYNPLDLTGSP